MITIMINDIMMIWVRIRVRTPMVAVAVLIIPFARRLAPSPPLDAKTIFIVSLNIVVGSFYLSSLSFVILL